MALFELVHFFLKLICIIQNLGIPTQKIVKMTNDEWRNLGTPGGTPSPTKPSNPHPPVMFSELSFLYKINPVLIIITYLSLIHIVKQYFAYFIALIDHMIVKVNNIGQSHR